MQKKRGPSKSRRIEELSRAVRLLRRAHPELAAQLQRERDLLSMGGEMPQMAAAERARIAGESRASSRDVMVQCAKALLESSPEIAHRLFVQAGALVTSRNLKDQISSMAAVARRRADEARAEAAKAVKLSKEVLKQQQPVE